MISWIFQSNPKKFDIDDYISNQDYIIFTIKQEHFEDQISPGDIVYIWRSDSSIKEKTGGIIAKGIILAYPERIPFDSPVSLIVIIRLDDIRLNYENGMLMRVDLEEDDILKDMKILNMRAETNYKLEPKHSGHIDFVWTSNEDKSTDLANRRYL